MASNGEHNYKPSKEQHDMVMRFMNLQTQREAIYAEQDKAIYNALHQTVQSMDGETVMKKVQGRMLDRQSEDKKKQVQQINEEAADICAQLSGSHARQSAPQHAASPAAPSELISLLEQTATPTQSTTLKDAAAPTEESTRNTPPGGRPTTRSSTTIKTDHATAARTDRVTRSAASSTLDRTSRRGAVQKPSAAEKPPTRKIKPAPTSNSTLPDEVDLSIQSAATKQENSGAVDKSKAPGSQRVTKTQSKEKAATTSTRAAKDPKPKMVMQTRSQTKKLERTLRSGFKRKIG